MAFGFKPVRYRDGTSYTGAAQRCFYKTAANLFVGDPVTISAAPDGANGVLEVELATAGAIFYGVVVGIEVTPTSGALNLAHNYLASGNEGYVMVATDTNVVYQCTEDGVVDALELVDIGKNVDGIAGAGGSTAFGTSSWMIDSSSHGTGTLGFTLLGVAAIEGNIDKVDGANATDVVWEVVINESVAAPNTAGI